MTDSPDDAPREIDPTRLFRVGGRLGYDFGRAGPNDEVPDLARRLVEAITVNSRRLAEAAGDDHEKIPGVDLFITFVNVDTDEEATFEICIHRVAPEIAREMMEQIRRSN